MTFQEMIELQGKPKLRNKPRDIEHQIQSGMVKWFKYQYPSMAHNLFSVPNGGKRDEVTGAKLKAEGALAGVADLLFLKPNRFYHGLLIEVKTKTGRQSDSQKEWEQKISKDGYKYIIVRSIEDFMREVKDYLSND